MHHPTRLPEVRKRLPAALLVGVLAGALPLASCRGRQGAASVEAIRRLQALQPTSSRTRILVLGTFHLRQIAKTFKPYFSSVARFW